MLALAASLERASEHPLAAAIVAGAEGRGARLTAVTDFASVTGKGVRGVVGGRRVALGNRALLDELKVDAGVSSRRPKVSAAKARPSCSSSSTAAPRA